MSSEKKPTCPECNDGRFSDVTLCEHEPTAPEEAHALLEEVNNNKHGPYICGFSCPRCLEAITKAHAAIDAAVQAVQYQADDFHQCRNGLWYCRLTEEAVVKAERRGRNEGLEWAARDMDKREGQCEKYARMFLEEGNTDGELRQRQIAIVLHDAAIAIRTLKDER